GVFPDGTIEPNLIIDQNDPTRKISRYIIEEKNKTYATDELKRELYYNLQYYSSKYYFIVQQEINNTGCAFVYIPFVKKTGAQYLGFALEAYGFELFTETSPVVVS